MYHFQGRVNQGETFFWQRLQSLKHRCLPVTDKNGLDILRCYSERLIALDIQAATLERSREERNMRAVNLKHSEYQNYLLPPKKYTSCFAPENIKSPFMV